MAAPPISAYATIHCTNNPQTLAPYKNKSLFLTENFVVIQLQHYSTFSSMDSLPEMQENIAGLVAERKS